MDKKVAVNLNMFLAECAEKSRIINRDVYLHRYLKDASLTGCAPAVRKLGEFYEANYEFLEAMKCYRFAQVSGDPYAACKLGLLKGSTMLYASPDYEAAIMKFKMAIAAKAEEGYYYLGLMYLYGNGVEQDEKKAFELWLEGSKRFSKYLPDHCSRLVADCYYEGKGVEIDKAKAYELYMREENQNHPLALISLAEMYLNGEVVEQNIVSACKLLNRAAECGEPSAYYLLAKIFSTNEYGVKDMETSAFFAQIGERHGDPESILLLAKYYLKGIGIDKDVANGISMMKYFISMRQRFDRSYWKEFDKLKKYFDNEKDWLNLEKEKNLAIKRDIELEKENEKKISKIRKSIQIAALENRIEICENRIESLKKKLNKDLSEEERKETEKSIKACQAEINKNYFFIDALNN